MNEEEIKDIIEILELAKEEIENNDENITATLDLQDLKSLKKLYDLYNKEKALNKEIQIRYKIENDKYNQEKEKNKELEKQQKELEPIKKLNIPVETLVSEFNRLEDLEDNTEMLKIELEKKDVVIDKMAEQLAGLTIWNNDIEEALILGDKQEIIKYFTNLVEKESK